MAFETHVGCLTGGKARRGEARQGLEVELELGEINIDWSGASIANGRYSVLRNGGCASNIYRKMGWMKSDCKLFYMRSIHNK